MMIGAISRGLGMDAFEAMSPGQIVDYCIAYNNKMAEDMETGSSSREAGQADFDAF